MSTLYIEISVLNPTLMQVGVDIIKTSYRIFIYHLLHVSNVMHDDPNILN